MEDESIQQLSEQTGPSKNLPASQFTAGVSILRHWRAGSRHAFGDDAGDATGPFAVVMVGIVLASVATIFALVMAAKIFTGEEQFTYYHHEIAVMAVAALLLWLLRQPILPYLDVTILGIGWF